MSAYPPDQDEGRLRFKGRGDKKLSRCKGKQHVWLRQCGLWWDSHKTGKTSDIVMVFFSGTHCLSWSWCQLSKEITWKEDRKTFLRVHGGLSQPRCKFPDFPVKSNTSHNGRRAGVSRNKNVKNFTRAKSSMCAHTHSLSGQPSGERQEVSPVRVSRWSSLVAPSSFPENGGQALHTASGSLRVPPCLLVNTPPTVTSSFG